MVRQHHCDGVGIHGFQAVGEGAGMMRKPVVHNPENALGIGIGFLLHHQMHQLVEGDNAGGLVHSAKDLAAEDIQRQMVLTLTVSTTCSATIQFRTSATENRLSGRPNSARRSQATALACTTC